MSAGRSASRRSVDRCRRQDFGGRSDRLRQRKNAAIEHAHRYRFFFAQRSRAQPHSLATMPQHFVGTAAQSEQRKCSRATLSIASTRLRSSDSAVRWGSRSAANSTDSCSNRVPRSLTNAAWLTGDCPSASALATDTDNRRRRSAGLRVRPPPPRCGHRYRVGRSAHASAR